MFFQQILTRCSVIITMLCSLSATSADLSYYLSNTQDYNSHITQPKEVLGFGIGERHIRHDQLLDYLTVIAADSNRIELKEIGRTYQHRKQMLLTISSPDNLANLATILDKRNRGDDSEGLPIVVWLGYSVHGDEISGANAAMVVAYHLAASQSNDIEQLLNDVIVVMEPSVNPDGMDRFSNWVTTFQDHTLNNDPNHIEHHQHWPSGRTNHYWFDLNRDWLLLSQQESVNRLKQYHVYQPNVLGDFHEMGANSSYFFQPGVPSRTNPITPKGNIELTHKMGQFHAKALDAEQRLYYSEENFDDFYYGKGSTYPDVNGAVGILFEQASSRGLQQETINGLLTFEFGIKNHVLTSLSTLEGAWQLKTELADYRKNFYQSGLKQAKKEKMSGYLIHEPNDHRRLSMFLSKLIQHQINVYPVSENFRLNSVVYPADNTYFVPLAQRQYRLIKALFSQPTDFNDNTFYDVSGWTLPLAMNIEFKPVARKWGLKLADKLTDLAQPSINPFTPNAYAYAIEWFDYFSPKLLNKLLAGGVKVKVTTKVFSSMINGIEKSFASGTLIIAQGFQQKDNWREILKTQVEHAQLAAFPLTTGLTLTGVDLGSNSFKNIQLPKVLLVGGSMVSQYEAGDIRYYLDQELEIPLSVVEQTRLAKLNFDDYTHILMVDGNYDNFSKSLTSKLIHWIRKGGVVYGQKRGAKWLADNDILNVNFADNEQLNQLFDTEGLTYQDQTLLAARKRIAGTIFETNLDISHPLAYGYVNTKLPVFKNSTLIIDKPKQPFISVASYTESPLLSGYTDKNLVNRLAHNTSVVAHNLGSGRVVATTENLVFRGYWQGTAKIIANTLFFAKAFSAPIKD